MAQPRPAQALQEKARRLRPAPSRVWIENVQPQVNSGRFPVKRTLGEELNVTADIHADGQAALAAVLRWRRAGEADWQETPMQALGNDAWRAAFRPEALGRYEYGLFAWNDPFALWQQGMAVKIKENAAETQDFLEGAELVLHALERGAGKNEPELRRQAEALAGSDPRLRTQAAVDPALGAAMAALADRGGGCAYERTLPLVVDREKAKFSAWYEMFPRSAGAPAGRGATFREAESRLEGIGRMGFDVLYLPPIHPIAKSSRKGPNNNPQSGPGDPGSPWAIGSAEGGHKAVNPELGTLADFEHFRLAAKDAGLELALDLAFQCSPEHPYVRQHPQWFRHRPDGAIRYAENPPKKYQDIYPLDFDCADWQALWRELAEVVFFWIGRGVKIFRVDNPHTKPYRFWKWLIDAVQARHPEALFLAEAFTRPKVMRCVAKCGFSQSYTYFTWRNTKQELTEYLTELTETEVREYLRPNLFANTPDIFHEYLQKGGRAAHMARLVLAATLGSSYGIYGPAFELCEGGFIPGTEDYLDSEKYQIRHWDWDRPGSIKPLIAKVNAIRRANAALRLSRPIRFCPTDNDQLIAYAKAAPDLSNIILVVVNLDPRNIQSGWVQVPWGSWDLSTYGPHPVVDLLNGARYVWGGPANYVKLDPGDCPAHILLIDKEA